MSIITAKEKLRKIIPSSAIAYYLTKREHPDAGWLEVIGKTRLIGCRHRMHSTEDFVRQTKKMYEKLELNVSEDYIYPYDSWVRRVVYHTKSNISSVTVDYRKVLQSRLFEIEQLLSDQKSSFAQCELKMIQDIRLLQKRILKSLSKRTDERGRVLYAYIERMLDNTPSCLDEALQKLLFYNALFWQAGHWQNGLGRLDMVLWDYYNGDLKADRTTLNEAKKMLAEFCQMLGKDMKAKSRALIGDTGQYILLGGIDENGENIENELTQIFLEIFTERSVPDPKLILRVNNNTSDAIWKQSIDCILKGTGSPLLMNEESIIKSMLEFGYKKEDVWNVGTSACWEPLIIGKSFDQNNPLLNIPVVDSLTAFMKSQSVFHDFSSFIEAYKKELEKQIVSCVHNVKFDCSPLYSLFFDDCIERGKDFSEGGAVYAWHGIQIAGFPNLINALLNVKTYIFDKKIFTTQESAKALCGNFKGFDMMRKALQCNSLKFGSTEKTVIDLTNDIMRFIGGVTSELKINGQKIKVGFSSSHYIIVSGKSKASFDGRCDGDPFAVHISPVSQKIDFQEVLDFASLLDYSGNRLNGNVVDFILPKAYIDQANKLKTILKASMKKGVFELQLNVLDAETLKDAKRHPEKYPHLIVRVWGFSAYFNDLPAEYQDNLIKRAESYA